MERITSRRLDRQVATINKLLNTLVFYVERQGGMGYKLHDANGHSWPSYRLTAREMYFYLDGFIDGIYAQKGMLV